MKRLFLLLLPALLFTSCQFNNNDDCWTEHPMLKIVATEPNGRPLVAADVWLYASAYDFENGNNVVRHGWTNSKGEILFDNLSETVYFFYVDHEGLGVDNWYGVNFTEVPLRRNEIFRAVVRTEPY